MVNIMKNGTKKLNRYHAVCLDNDDIFYVININAYSIREAMDLCDEQDFIIKSIIEVGDVPRKSTSRPKIKDISFKSDINKHDINPYDMGYLKWYSKMRR